MKSGKLNYTQKADYGKVPAYLARNKAKIAAEKAAIQEYMSMQEQQNQGDSMVEMPMEERENLKHLHGEVRRDKADLKNRLGELVPTLLQMMILSESES